MAGRDRCPAKPRCKTKGRDVVAQQLPSQDMRNDSRTSTSDDTQDVPKHPSLVSCSRSRCDPEQPPTVSWTAGQHPGTDPFSRNWRFRESVTAVWSQMKGVLPHPFQEGS